MEEAKEFILKKLNECMLFIHNDYPESIFHIWDKQLLRIKKLQRISNNKEIDFKPNKNSIILFEQDYKTGYFWYNYNNIHLILIEEYKIKNIEIKELIKDILMDDNKMRSLIPICIRNTTNTLMEDNKMKSLTPNMLLTIQNKTLMDDNKMRELTPVRFNNIFNSKLKDDNKMKYLIPLKLI